MYIPVPLHLPRNWATINRSQQHCIATKSHIGFFEGVHLWLCVCVHRFLCVHVCLYVCVCLCVYVGIDMYLCLYLCIYFMYICVFIWFSLPVYIYIYVYICVFLCVFCVFLCFYVWLCFYYYVFMNMYILCVSLCDYVCLVSVYLFMCICVCIYVSVSVCLCHYVVCTWRHSSFTSKMPLLNPSERHWLCRALCYSTMACDWSARYCAWWSVPTESMTQCSDQHCQDPRVSLFKLHECPASRRGATFCGKGKV